MESERCPLGLEELYMAENILPEAEMASALNKLSTDRFFTEEQFQQDVDYFRAQQVAKSMLDSGLISLLQFNRLTELNRKTFSPFLSEIMPKMT